MIASGTAAKHAPSNLNTQKPLKLMSKLRVLKKGRPNKNKKINSKTMAMMSWYSISRMIVMPIKFTSVLIIAT